MIKMIICNNNKIHDLDHDVIRHWIHLKKLRKCLELVAAVGWKVVNRPLYERILHFLFTKHLYKK